MKAAATLETLIHELDKAMDAEDCGTRCRMVKDVLEHSVKHGGDILDPKFLEPVEGCYARRLIHKDPAGRYTVLAMVWAPGQGTALHDHCGMWCVECVYRGRIQVDSYALDKESQDGRYWFHKETTQYADPGDAGALIPPFEYHILSNALNVNAVTIHVYGGEMKFAHVYLPEEGAYRSHRKELCYTP
ncbi:MAG: cysteine dioxygenase family protein [Armatimonadetes bacterium]|nr:cysteine dioxygenase family protein [Armatimonadota bacterium]